MASPKTVVSVDGHRIGLTHLEKVLYPETGTTKADVLDYYARIADVLIPHAADRPLTRKRWVDGVGTPERPGTMFFQKNLDASTPSWVPRRSIEHSDHSNDYPLLNDRATLTWLGQISAIELHVPQWRFGRTGLALNPDRLVLDLDPGEGAGLAECAEVARMARAILTDMGLDPHPVTSGSKGIHLYAALDEKQDSAGVSAVARELARALEADHPDLVVSDMKKSLRGGKVLVDWSQNSRNKTTVAPYSLRGRFQPTVAAPRTWAELDDPHLRHLDYREVLDRVAAAGDPLAALGEGHRAALEPTPDHLDRFEASPAAQDRLTAYRSKRDAAKTPEPVPASAPVPRPDGATFVIQEHHARALHFDFRLEHDGVLVSWALPKGVPVDATKNHLAVQTEDHPLEYGLFEGTIPKGEYGAGEVTIWDSGTIDVEKWREGKEVIATLHGEKHGTNRYALIHTGGRGGRSDNNWLIHLMAPKVASGPSESASDAASPGASTTEVPAKRVSRRKVVGSPRRAASIAPMLATLGASSDIDEDDDWAFEMKWDGIRAIAAVQGGAVTFTSRNGNDLTATYPELAGLAGSVDGDAVIDGEIVALDARGRPDFGRLQRRMNLTRESEVDAAMAETPVLFFAFDLLGSGTRSHLGDDYDDRRSALSRVVHEQGPVRVPPAFEGDLAAAIDASRRLGLEGVMAKRRDGTYSVGRRSKLWVKIKHQKTQEAVIAGWRQGRGRRADSLGSLLLGIPDLDGGGLRYIGRVGTGFSDRDLTALAETLASMGRATSPLDGVPAADAADAHWVTPKLVGEVEFLEWTAEGRLRHATWRGLRPDKAVADIRPD